MDVEKRLAVLERRVKVMAGLVVVLAAALLMGASGGSVPKEVRARSFVLEGPGGEVLSDWRFAPSKDAGFGDTSLNFYDGRGRPRINLACMRNGFATVGVLDGSEGDDSGAAIEIGQDGTGRFIAEGKDGRPIFSRP